MFSSSRGRNVNRRFLLSYCSTVLLQYCINYLLPCFLASFHPFSHVLCYTLYAIHHPSSVICHVIRRSLYTVHSTPHCTQYTVCFTAALCPMQMCICAYPAPSTQYPVLTTRHPVPSTQHPVLSSLYSTSLSLYPSTPVLPSLSRIAAARAHYWALSRPQTTVHSLFYSATGSSSSISSSDRNRGTSTESVRSTPVVQATPLPGVSSAPPPSTCTGTPRTAPSDPADAQAPEGGWG
jgi:hypothetical protein